MVEQGAGYGMLMMEQGAKFETVVDAMKTDPDGAASLVDIGAKSLCALLEQAAIADEELDSAQSDRRTHSSLS